MSDYPAFGKIPRLNRDVVITEKIDGTNGLIAIFEPEVAFTEQVTGAVAEDGTRYFVKAGSRNRWLYHTNEQGDPNNTGDNHGFARWVKDNAKTLVNDLGPGLHYGEWWGQGIQRRYDLDHKRFSLFNAGRWVEDDFHTPNLHVVPVLAEINAKDMNYLVRDKIGDLKVYGSVAAPGFMNPEGLIVFHTASRHLYKVTLEGDEKPKGKS
jgi:hypothetical protein